MAKVARHKQSQPFSRDKLYAATLGMLTSGVINVGTDLARDRLQDDLKHYLTGDEFQNDGTRLSDKVLFFFEKINNQVFREGLGNVIFSNKGIKSSIGHGVGRGKAVTFAALPDVIKYGKQIDSQKNWKGRGYDTVVFAAPVNIQGNKVYVGAVVKQALDNRYYVHEVMDSDGNIFVMSNAKTEDSNDARPGPHKSGYSDSLKSSVSIDRIPQNGDAVNESIRTNAEFMHSARGLENDPVTRAYLTAVIRDGTMKAGARGAVKKRLRA